MNAKSGKVLASTGISKNDLRYWLARVFKPKKIKSGKVVHETAFYFARFQYRGRRITISLGTGNQAEAAGRAKERYLFLVTNGWADFLAEYQPVEGVAPARRANITVGEYIEAAAAESRLAPETIYQYARSFRRIVADAMGIKGTKRRFDYRGGGNRQWIEKINAVHLAAVTPEKITAWKKKFIAAAGSDVIARRRATVSCNSFVRQAKALFSKRNVLDKLKSVELPAVLPFDGVSVERRTDTKFYGCGVDAHQLLRDAVAELGTDRAEELKAFLLALVLGLRRREADMLQWDSFDFTTGTLRVKPNAWYKLKTNESAAVLPVDPEILALFRAWKAKAKSGFVIESNLEPKAVSYQWYRCEETFKSLLDWLRSKGVQGYKPIHQMRKLYGSVMADLHGIHVASAALRHSDIRTTSESYADRTVKLTAGFGSVLSGASLTPFPDASGASVRGEQAAH